MGSVSCKTRRFATGRLTHGRDVDRCPAGIHSRETTRIVGNQRRHPGWKNLLHFRETCGPVLGWQDQDHIVEAMRERNGSVVPLVVLHHIDVNLRHRFIGGPHEKLLSLEQSVGLDAVGWVRQQHVPTNTIEHAVLPNTRCCCRPLGLLEHQTELHSCPVLKLVFEPVESQGLILLEKVLEAMMRFMRRVM